MSNTEPGVADTATRQAISVGTANRIVFGGKLVRAWQTRASVGLNT